MATCKDCVGYNFCSRKRDGETDYLGKEIGCGNVEDLCGDFKNKADVVPVVRCSQCRKRYTTECALQFGFFVCCLSFNDDFFCAYGERK